MISKKLPENWQIAPLSDYCTVVSGATPRRDTPRYWGGDIPWATPKELSRLSQPVLEDTEEKITKEGYQSCSVQLIPAGSILFSSRAPIGHVAIAGREMCTNQGFKNLVPGPEIDSSYLYRCIKYLTPVIVSRGRGVTFKEVSKEIIEAIEIPLPPLEEQKRIASILDKADTIRRKRTEALRTADDFLRSTFHYTVGPGATRYTSWPEKTVSDLAALHPGSMKTGPFGSSLRHSEFVDEGIAVLGIDNAVNNRFEWAQRRFITKEKYKELERYTVSPGDVLITIMGTTGRTAVVPEIIPTAISTKHLATITLNKELARPQFVAFSIRENPEVLRQIAMANKGAIMDGLNLTIIKGLRLRIPPVGVQKTFEAIVACAEKTRTRLLSLRDESNILFNSLVQRAFRGEL